MRGLSRDILAIAVEPVYDIFERKSSSAVYRDCRSFAAAAATPACRSSCRLLAPSRAFDQVGPRTMRGTGVDGGCG